MSAKTFNVLHSARQDQTRSITVFQDPIELFLIGGFIDVLVHAPRAFAHQDMLVVVRAIGVGEAFTGANVEIDVVFQRVMCVPFSPFVDRESARFVFQEWSREGVLISGKRLCR
jgi:hypothetical protein